MSPIGKKMMRISRWVRHQHRMVSLYWFYRRLRNPHQKAWEMARNTLP
jgi:hypothetical protein